MTKQAPIETSSAHAAAITIKIEDGQTVTFRPEAVLAILTKPDGKASTILLQGGNKVPVKGNGEGLRKKVFGLDPAEVQAAIKQQGARGAKRAAEA